MRKFNINSSNSPSKNLKRDFSVLKDQISKKIKDNDNQLTKAYKYLYSKIDIFDQNITKENYVFFKGVFDSISNSHSNVKDLQDNCIWPMSNNSLGYDEKRSDFLDLLISYSKEVDNLEILRSNPNWIALCELSEPDSLMDEFIKQKAISIGTLTNYDSVLKAKLLVNLYHKNKKIYCNTCQIINFFNTFIDRNQILDDIWIQIAQTLSKNYPIDFIISIPNFYPMDVFSLLFNPLTKTQGVVFKKTKCPKELTDYLCELYDELIQTESKRTFEFLKDRIIYLKSTYHGLYEPFKIALDILESIKAELNIDSNYSNVLDFSDVTEIDPKFLKEYVDENPCIGFYIARFPHVLKNYNIVANLCKRRNFFKFPLALFLFRIFTGINFIRFQLSCKVSNYFIDEILEFLHNEICFHLNNSDPKSIQFSNLIPFLLPNAPSFIDNAYHSNYLRNIFINLISQIKDKILQEKIFIFLKIFLPKIIEILITSKWNNYIDEVLCYDSEDEIVRFLTNPWEFVLHNIDKIVDNANILYSMIISFTSEQSISKLEYCVNEDELILREKKYHEFLRTRINNSAIENILVDKWAEYSRYVKSYMNQIPDLVLEPKSEESSYSKIFEPKSSYDHFHQFFSQKLNYFPSRECEVIVVIPNNPDLKEYTLKYTYQKKRKSVRFYSLEGEIMLFLPPEDCSIESLKLNCDGAEVVIDIIHFSHDSLYSDESSMDLIEESYICFNQYFKFIKKEDFEEDNYYHIIDQFKNIKVLFGNLYFDEFIEKIYSLCDECQFDMLKKCKYDNISKIKNILLELDNFTNISYSMFNDDNIPQQTKNYISTNLSKIIQFAKQFHQLDFKLFADEINKKMNLYKISKEEGQILLNLSHKFSLIPQNDQEMDQHEMLDGKFEILKQEMDRIEKNYNLIIPIIFLNYGKLEVTVKKIEMYIDSLYFGVNISPLRIFFENFTKEEITCTFNQKNKELPKPSHKNTSGFLTIDIPIDQIFTKNENTKQLTDIEKTFTFEGTISLSIASNPKSSFNVDYNISFHFIPLQVFISIKNNHFFAYDKEKVEIVPFIAKSNSQLLFEKFTDTAIKGYYNISEINDNKAKKPELYSRFNNEDGRITDITTIFAKEDKKENSYLSIYFEFGLTNEIIQKMPLHINILPTSDRICQLNLVIFSDKSKDFTNNNAIINVGNLKRSVYFIVELLNTSNEPISPDNIVFNSDNEFISVEYDKSKNPGQIQPSQYGCVICYFDVIYLGPFPIYDQANGSITISMIGISQTIEFKYVINAIDYQNRRKSTNLNQFCVYDNEKASLTKCNINDILNYQLLQYSKVLVSPFCFAFDNTSEIYPRIEYDREKGIWSNIFYNHKYMKRFKICRISNGLKIPTIVTVDTLKRIHSSREYTPLFISLANDPSSFFPFFCPINNKHFQFDSSDVDMIESNFIQFFLDILPETDRKNRESFSTIDSIFDNTPLPSIVGYSFLIDLLGKGRNQVMFDDLVSKIAEFTQNDNFKKNYEKSKKELTNLPNAFFYSFIIALNELINERYESLKSMNYYIQLPIEFEKYDKAKEKCNIFDNYINENMILNSNYVEEMKNRIGQINRIEQEEISKFEMNGMKISPIIKWTEATGFESSTIEELNDHKKINIRDQYKVNIIPNKGIGHLDEIINYIRFQNNISIKSLYCSFNEILNAIYYLPTIIYKLKESDKSLYNAKFLLNRLIAILFWYNEFSEFLPFLYFKNNFVSAFSSMVRKLVSNNLKSMGLLTYLLKIPTNSLEFFQLPSMSICKSSSLQSNSGDDDDDDIIIVSPGPKKNENKVNETIRNPTRRINRRMSNSSRKSKKRSSANSQKPKSDDDFEEI